MNRCSILLFLFISLLISCSKKNSIDHSYKYITIFYMSGNNNLRQDIKNAIIKLQKGYTVNDNNKIIVYVKTTDKYSHIINIKPSLSSEIISDTVKTYVNTNASDPNHLKQVIRDIKTTYPSQKYSLILSSHATSWYPKKDVNFKSFGLDQSQELDIKDLNYCLQDINLEYIIFDACYMSSIEVLYELRKRAKYIIASPSEVISYGLPYEKIANMLFANEKDLINICDEYINYYETLNGNFKSANIALINTSNLDYFIQDLNKIFFYMKDYELSIQNVQNLVFDSSSNIEAYDIVDFIKKNKNNISPPTINIDEIISKIVVYSRSTKKFNGNPINSFNGVSIYFPYINKTNIQYNQYYKTYSFYNNSGISFLYNRMMF